MTLVDGEDACLVVPLEGDGRVDALLVVVVVAFILVEGKLGIGTGVYNDVEIVPCLLGSVLYVGAEGNDTACLDE